jgi:hypothetical protein
MMLKKDFALRQIADLWVVLPLGDRDVDFSAMLTLNESGALLWKALEKGADRDGLVDALLAEYEVSETEAAADVDAFLAKLAQAGCIC